MTVDEILSCSAALSDAQRVALAHALVLPVDDVSCVLPLNRLATSARTIAAQLESAAFAARGAR